MAKNINYVSHKKSNVKNQDGTPMLPSASDLVDGEIAVNYADGVETLSIKNDSGNVITFSSDNYYTEKKLGSGFTGENSANTVTKVIEDNELAISSSLNDLNERKLDASAYTPTDLTNYYTKSQTSGASEIQGALDEKQNTLSAGTNISITDNVISVSGISIDQVLDNTTSASTNAVSTKAVYDAVTDNELVWTNAYVAMSGNVSSHTVNTDVHLSSADRILIDSLPTTLNSKAEKSLDLDNLKLLRMSQSDYNALVTKDPNTLYIITS